MTSFCSGLKAIETNFKGFRFRSRLEARWAVFFDALGMHWDYEIEGFELSNGERYLPDFRLETPQGEPIWVEIKPSNIKSDIKFSKFKDDLDYSKRCFLAIGPPLRHLALASVCPRCGIMELPRPSDLLVKSGDIRFDDLCGYCDMETPSGGGHKLRFDGLAGCCYTPHKGSIEVSQRCLSVLEKKLLDAAVLARRARFEHGESPATSRFLMSQ